VEKPFSMFYVSGFFGWQADALLYQHLCCELVEGFHVQGHLVDVEYHSLSRISWVNSIDL
jgi:hypothetical protein